MKTDSLIRAAQRSAAIVVLLAGWEVLPDLGIIRPAYLPALHSVLAAFWHTTASGELLRHLAISLQRAFLGFALAIIVNIPLGLFVGWYKGVERTLEPILKLFMQIPGLALFPLFILFFGIGELSKVLIIFYACMWSILLNTISGVRNVDPLFVKSARSMGASNFALFRKVVLPAAVPPVLTGVRLGAATAVVLLVAAEMLGASSGLGFLVMDSQFKFETEKMYVAIITIALLGLALNCFLIWLERRMTVWKEQPHM